MTACSWSSSKWEHLGNRDLTFVRVSAGRFDDDRVLDLDDDELISTLLEELSLTVDVQAMPVESKVIRWPRSFPQYELGHSKRVDEIQRLLRDETQGFSYPEQRSMALGSLPVYVMGQLAPKESKITSGRPIEMGFLETQCKRN